MKTKSLDNLGVILPLECHVLENIGSEKLLVLLELLDVADALSYFILVYVGSVFVFLENLSDYFVFAFSLYIEIMS